MNNEELRILKNTIEQMACDADDKGLTDFGLRLSVADAFTLCKLEPPRRWIPCSERMPEMDDNYICVYHFDSSNKNYVSTLFFYATDPNPHFQCDGYQGLKVTVTHWMPPPEPPKEGGAENAAY